MKKEIKADTELEKGNLLYEDDRAVLYFDRELTLKILKNHNFDMWDVSRNRLNEYIENIENGDTIIFAPPFLEENICEVNLKYRILQSLLLNSKFSVFNKSTGVYEKYLIYDRRSSGWGCCFVHFNFPNGDRFITTQVFTDNIIVDICDE